MPVLGRVTRPARLVALPGGPWRVGTDDPLLPKDGEGPARVVTLRPFAIDPFAVTNDDFATFVAATGYVTEAERFGWSAVFHLFAPVDAARPTTDAPPWWVQVERTSWAAPEGAGSGLGGRGDHPVLHVSWHDAAAYAAWAGGRLPTEAEWEYAASGGLAGARYPWGGREPDDTQFQPCNIWQGRFPDVNDAADGYVGTAPVGAFAANGFGLFNMCGNAWEWCADIFRIRSLGRAAKLRNAAALAQEQRVLKGGSYLCHRSYCHRYRIAARSGATADSSTGHVGFRLVYD
jgi:formylglycine-generating enzyme required for sulfatase activity